MSDGKAKRNGGQNAVATKNNQLSSNTVGDANDPLKKSPSLR